jgi:hypothetical protein
MTKKIIVLVLLIACITNTYSQVGIGIIPPASTAELELASTTSGILIPRLTDAQMTTLGTGAGATEKSLLIYNVTQHKFYFWDGTAWQQLGGVCNEINDEDGDTRIEVEKTTNEDKIRITAGGSEKVAINKDSTSIENGDLTINSGTFTVNSQYSLPTTDGLSGYALSIDNTGTVSWQNPGAALGLVVGIQTSSFTNVDQFIDIQNKTYYSRVMSWATITVSKMAFLVEGTYAGAVIPQMGIYDVNGNLVASGTGASIANGVRNTLIEVTLSSRYTLQSGQIYHFAIAIGATPIRVYDKTYNSGADYSARYDNAILPVSATFTNNTDKGIWIAAY